MPFDGFGNYGNSDFDTVHEKTRMKGKVYVVRTDTDEVIGIVGNTRPRHTHRDLFEMVDQTVFDMIPEWAEDAVVNTRTSRNGAWALREIRFPKVPRTVETDKHSTMLAPLVVFWSSLDNSSSNNSLTGAVDFYCTNLTWKGNASHIKMKNSKNFLPSNFAAELLSLKDTFLDQVNYLSALANTQVSYNQIKQITEDLFPERKAKLMLESIMQEVGVRGYNLWAVQSAFTQYASHSDRFKFRETKEKDNLIERQFNRNREVAKWLEHDAFKMAA